MIELADKLTPIALLLLLALGIVALGLMFASPSRLRPASLVAISLVLAGEVWWIVFYAQGPGRLLPQWKYTLGLRAEQRRQAMGCHRSRSRFSVDRAVVVQHHYAWPWCARWDLAGRRFRLQLSAPGRLVRSYGWSLSSARISEPSGNRPSACFEKTTAPSANTSYWPLRAFLNRRLVSRFVQLGRETRSPHVVAVSDGAVLDQDARHDANLPAKSS